MKKKKLFFFCMAAVLCITLPGNAADTLKIMSYNILNYGNDEGRNEYFRKVISSTSPDVLVVQEIKSQKAVNNFLNNILNVVFPGEYTAGIFIDGPDTDNAVFYKISRIEFIHNKPVKTILRDINEFAILPLNGYDTLRIYSVHLKASNSSADQIRRAAEVDSLRKVTNKLPAGNCFIVLGDFNIYKSDEPAYQKLIQVQTENNGHVHDLISMSGVWNNFIYSAYHTQSPRTRSFGGGATGGLDDRFDMILFSTAVKNAGGITYINNSTVPFGNDGNHYNDSINQMPNSIVSQDIANALHYASDHLPLYALFTYERSNTSIAGNISHAAGGYVLYRNYPNPFNPSTTISFTVPSSSEVTMKIFNALGKEISTVPGNGVYSEGTHERTLDLTGYPSGIYYLRFDAFGLTGKESITLSQKVMLVK
jgi:exonuclease III